jgi:Rrf2 family protein
MLAERAGEMVLVAQIADRQRVPKKFLELILLELKKHGLLYSQRGRHGGDTLGRPSTEITFGQVVRIIDGPLAPLPCASLTGYRRCADCQDEASCAIPVVMRRVRDAMAAILDATTIADAVAGHAHSLIAADWLYGRAFERGRRCRDDACRAGADSHLAAGAQRELPEPRAAEFGLDHVGMPGERELDPADRPGGGQVANLGRRPSAVLGRQDVDVVGADVRTRPRLRPPRSPDEVRRLPGSHAAPDQTP